MKYDPFNYNNRKPTPIWVYQERTEWAIYLKKKVIKYRKLRHLSMFDQSFRGGH